MEISHLIQMEQVSLTLAFLKLLTSLTRLAIKMPPQRNMLMINLLGVQLSLQLLVMGVHQILSRAKKLLPLPVTLIFSPLSLIIPLLSLTVLQV